MGQYLKKKRHNSKYCSTECSKKADTLRKNSHYLKNKEDYIERARAYRLSDPERYRKYMETSKKKGKSKEYSRVHYEKHREAILKKSSKYGKTEKRRKYMEEYRKENKDRINKSCRKYKKKPRSQKVLKNGHLKRNFGITLEDYTIMLENQNKKCAICNLEEKGKDLAVDHCHDTGKVRGLLCFNCNSSLGKFNDDIKMLERAIEYLKGKIKKEIL